MSRALPPLYLLGAGGLGEETAEAVRAANQAAPAWDLRRFRRRPGVPRSTVVGLPVVGPMSVVADTDDALAVACIARPGDAASRPTVVERLGVPDERWATVLHPRVRPRIGDGTVLLADVVLTASVAVGRRCVVRPQVSAAPRRRRRHEEPRARRCTGGETWVAAPRVAFDGQHPFHPINALAS